MRIVQAMFAFLLCIGFYPTYAQATKDTTSGPSIKNLDNGIGFTIVECTGDKGAQRVTVSFKFTNPDKPNQKISIADPVRNLYPTAIDEDGNNYTCSRITLGALAATNRETLWPMRAGIDLPTGIALKGSVSFTNIPPGVHTLAYVKIYEKSSNAEGGGDVNTGNIELRNIAINWK